METDDAPDNPLARATANLLGRGQRFTRMTHASLVEPTTGARRWLGVFVLGSSGRLVFFPGFSEHYNMLASGGDVRRAGSFDKEFAVDHVTLESDQRDWHFTQRTKRAGQERGGKTVDVGDGRVLWLGMTVESARVLREMKATTVARARSPLNDNEVQDRIRCFNEAVSNSVPAELVLPSRPAQPSALHFTIVVGPTGAPAYTGPHIAFAGSLQGGKVDANTSRLRLSAEREVQVLAMWLPGVALPGITFVPPG